MLSNIRHRRIKTYAPHFERIPLSLIQVIYRTLRRKLAKVSLRIHRRNLLKRIQGGEGLHLEGKITVIYEDKLLIGRNVHIGRNTFIDCKGGVTIGDNAIISRFVTIYSHDHNFKKPTSLPYDQNSILKKVEIGRYVWIGQNVAIAPGTQIGDGAVIGLGTVLSGTVPENAIVVGPKTRVVGYRDPKHTTKLCEENRYFEHPTI